MIRKDDVMQSLMDWLDKQNVEVNEDNIEDLMDEFFRTHDIEVDDVELTDEDKAFALFDQARQEEDVDKVEKLLEEALKLKPDFFDARMELSSIQLSNPVDLVRQWKELLAEEKEKLKKQGYFHKKNIGEFWMIFEMRPYMRGLYELANQYIEMNSYHLAKDILEEMLTLDADDHAGARYDLAGCYMMLEKYDKFHHLLKKYPDGSVAMTLFQSIVAYCCGHYEEAKECLLDLKESVPDFVPFIQGELDEDMIDKQAYYGSYQPGTVEEIIVNLFPFHRVLDNDPYMAFVMDCIDGNGDSSLN